MNTFVVLFAVFAVAVARPQGAGPSTQCERREVAPGKFEYICQVNPGELLSERTLWIPTSGSNQDLLIRVPNYNFREIVRAGFKSGDVGGTNVRIHVARPDVDSQVEGEFHHTDRDAPQVHLTYDQVQNEGEVHYGGTGTPYRPFSRPISEPGASRVRY